MNAVVLLSGWDTALLMAPFFALLGFWMFGVDERVAAPRGPAAPRRYFCQVKHHGRAVMTDPDGRPWKTSRGFREEHRSGAGKARCARPRGKKLQL